MKTLVNEFRDYARLPAAHLIPIELNALVAEVLGLYGSAQESGRLHADLAPELPAIVGDSTQLRQVIHNLVQNALDAVEGRDGGHVRLVTETTHADDGSVRAVRLVITDNGPGFTEKVMKRAFEPYVTTKPKGTGLGLAVVKKIADENRAESRANLHAPTSPTPRSSAQACRIISSVPAAAPVHDLRDPAISRPAIDALADLRGRATARRRSSSSRRTPGMATILGGDDELEYARCSAKSLAKKATRRMAEDAARRAKCANDAPRPGDADIWMPRCRRHHLLRSGRRRHAAMPSS